MGIRRVTKEDGVDHAKHRCGGADAESQREDGCYGKYGISAKAADRIAQVEENRFDEWQTGSFAIGLAGLLRAAQQKERLAPRLLCAES